MKYEGVKGGKTRGINVLGSYDSTLSRVVGGTQEVKSVGTRVRLYKQNRKEKNLG